MTDAVEKNMRALRARYLEQLQERVQQIELLVPLMEAGSWSTDDRGVLKSQAHKLAGTGATYGFPAISEAGHRLEEALLEHPQEEGALFIPLAQTLLKACQDALASKENPIPAFGRKKVPAVAAVVEEQKPLPLLLAVDDDENIRDIMFDLFKDDARVMTGTNTVEALELMRTHKPDLVLMDDMMPGGISGLRFLEEIRSQKDIADIPIVMITASDKPDEVMRGLLAGAVDYITKPFNPEEVASKIRTRLGRLSSTVLIADDDEAVRELLAHKFRSAGCKVELASDGAEAWAYVQNHAVGLALLDRMMPGMDGVTLLHRMKETPALAAIPVVFLTAKHYGADVLEGLNTGAADYITKPFNPDEVVARCTRLLHKTAKPGS